MSWIGVDFDGTLVTDVGPWPQIGEPVPIMVNLVKKIIDAGIVEVVIFTARCFNEDGSPDCLEVLKVMQWCETHLGTQLRITCMKNKDMLLLIDDRAVAVERNTGRQMTFRADLLDHISKPPQPHQPTQEGFFGKEEGE